MLFDLVVSLLSHDVPDVLVGFRTDDGRGNIEPSRVTKDGDIRYHEAIVEEHDDKVKDVQTLVVGVFPVSTIEGTRTRDVIPDEWNIGVGIWVSGNLECRLCDAHSCRTRDLDVQTTECVNEGRLTSNGEMETIFPVLDRRRVLRGTVLRLVGYPPSTTSRHPPRPLWPSGSPLQRQEALNRPPCAVFGPWW